MEHESKGLKLEELLAAMLTRLQKLETSLAELSGQQAAYSYTINIDTLHIHDPILENLTFRLDQLDIDQLSGALNLGNNFGTHNYKGMQPANTEDSKEGPMDKGISPDMQMPPDISEPDKRLSLKSRLQIVEENLWKINERIIAMESLMRLLAEQNRSIEERLKLLEAMHP